MSITAQTIITGALQLCNVLAAGEDPSTDDNTDCLRRLNNLVQTLNNQKMIAAFQAREVFALVADQGTYTIGPGGDFDTTRPFELEGAAILQNPTIAGPFSIDDADPTTGTFTINSSDETASFPSGAEFVVSGSTGNDGSYTVVSSVFSTNTVITVVEAVVDDTADGEITSFASDNSTIEIPRTIYTDDAWQSIQVKSLSNSLATGVYFNANYARGLAAIQLWPVPNIATNALVLYRRNMLATFVDLDTAYDVPAGFEELLEYNLARRLLTPYAIKDEAVRADVLSGARSAMLTVKRTNAVNQVNDMPIDPAWTHDRRGYYNINTSNY